MSFERNIKLEIEVPEGMLPEIRGYVVIYGGEIVKEVKSEDGYKLCKVDEAIEKIRKKRNDIHGGSYAYVSKYKEGIDDALKILEEACK